MTILNVAEKPSVARSISRILSTNCSTSRGKHKYCPNISFTYKEPMLFTSVLGHLLSLDFTDKRKWTEMDPFDLFSSNVTKTLSEDMALVAENIKNAARKCDMLVIWTDCDREGENIARQIRSLVPSLKAKRARFSGITRSEIENALENLVEINEDEADAVDARMELDLRIGSAFTRLQTLSCTSIADKDRKILSFGPCQIPTLNFAVQRHFQIQNFIPEKFFSLENPVEKSNSGGDAIKNVFKWVRGSIFDRNFVVYFFSLLNKGRAVIVDKSVEEKTKYRPLPLRTVEFQKACANIFRMSGHKLMEIAEKLYNNGYISYPRTETDSFPKNFGFNSVISKLKSDNELGTYASNFKFKTPRSGKNNDQAHSPIYPLKDGSDLSGNERRVYDFIARRFLGCISEDAKGVETSYTMKIFYSNKTHSNLPGNISNEEFKAKGLVITERNYLDVYTFDKWESTPISNFNINEVVENRLNLTEGSTTTPEYLTESDLISLMDKNGIGTDATIHEHIQKIQSRGYAEKINCKMVPKALGINLIKAYNLLGLNVSEPTLRKNLEENLVLVSRGIKNKDLLVEDEISIYKRIYKRLEDSIDTFKSILDSDPGPIDRPGYKGSRKPGDGDSEGSGPFDRGSKKQKRANRQDYRNTDKNENESNTKYKNKGVAPLSTDSYKSNSIETRFKNDNYRNNNDNYKNKTISPTITDNYKSNKIANKVQERSNEEYKRKRPVNTFDNANLDESPPFSIQKYNSTLKSNLQVINCDCGKEASKLEAKTGANAGKVFYTCFTFPKSCSFFKLVDEKENINTNSCNKKSFDRITTEKRISKSAGCDDKDIKCYCGFDTVKKVANTETNKGREFYCCNKNYKRCKFFLWVDEAGE